jgi:hypothetical protein
MTAGARRSDSASVSGVGISSAKETYCWALAVCAVAVMMPNDKTAITLAQVWGRVAMPSIDFADPVWLWGRLGTSKFDVDGK